MDNFTDNCLYRDDNSVIVRIVNLVGKHCRTLNLNKYNLHKCVSYTCKGYDLIGSTCGTQDKRRHFLVKNNHYKVYEFPMKGNRGLRMTGKFLVLFHNLDFKYWTIALMTHSFVRSECNNITEHVEYDCCGEFSVTYDTAGNLAYRAINKFGDKCCRGFRSKAPFDSDNVRKESGYHTTYKIINKTFGITAV